MNEYNYGTGARKLDKPHVEPKKRVVQKKKKVNKVFVFSFLLATALAFTLLGRYSVITEKTAQIEALKKEYNAVNSVVVAEEFEFEKSIDLKKIEEIATTKLGMQRPEKHQMVYIAMDNQDYCEVTTPEKTGFLANMMSGVQRFVEYFR